MVAYHPLVLRYQICNYFDVVFFHNKIHLKSKTFDFSTSMALKSASLCNFLKEHKCTGKVIFDLLASNGMEWNRFIEVMFDGEKFSSECKIVNIENVGYANEYYKNKEYVDLAGTVLTEEEILQITQEK